MTEFLLLFKTQFLSIISGTFASSRKAKKSNYTGYIIFVLFMLAYASFYEYIMITTAALYGSASSILSMVAVAASMLAFISSVSATKKLIFTCRDYDFVASLPVKSTTVVLAKLATLYATELIYSGIFMLPCGIIYGTVTEQPGYFYLAYYLLMLFLPMLPIVIGAVVSAFVSFISAHFKHSKTVGTAIYVLFFVLVMYAAFSFTSSESSDEQLALGMASIAAKLGGIYPPAVWFVKATADGKLLYGLLLALLSAGLFLLTCAILGASFKRAHSMFLARNEKVKYSLDGGSSSSPFKALLGKELSKIFSSSILLLNSFAGLILMLIFAVMFVFGSGMISQLLSASGEVDSGKNVIVTIIPLVFGMFSLMTCTTNSSISLEGHSVGILKSLPVSAKTVCKAKIAAQLVITVPAMLVCGTMFLFSGELSVAAKAAMYLIPLACTYVIAVLGMLVNLGKPNFDWSSEVVVVKQGMPVFVTMIGGMVFMMIIIGISAALSMFLSQAIVLLTAFLLFVFIGVVLTLILSSNCKNLYAKM